MLSSVSSFQPVFIGSQTPQHSFDNQKKPTGALDSKEDKDTLKSESSKLTQKAFDELTKEDQKKVQKLKSRDLEVKAHEQAHLSAAGALSIGGASFTYTIGPNGVRYAIGGEVSIDTSSVEGDPAATIKKADAIRRAALAPASPSSQDQIVASNAAAMSEKARLELVQQTQKDKENLNETKDTEATEEEKTESNNQINNTANTIPSTGSLIDLTI